MRREREKNPLKTKLTAEKKKIPGNNKSNWGKTCLECGKKKIGNYSMYQVCVWGKVPRIHFRGKKQTFKLVTATERTTTFEQNIVKSIGRNFREPPREERPFERLRLNDVQRLTYSSAVYSQVG